MRPTSEACPNSPIHHQIELAFYDDEFHVYHWHCVTPIPAGGVCHAEWANACLEPRFGDWSRRCLKPAGHADAHEF
jgi:hypothetical protein